MSAPQSEALDAVAFELVAALEKYDRDAGRMVEAWPDLDLYREVSDGIERIRTYCGAIAEVSVQWVELLVAHSELVHSLWRLQYGDGNATREQLVPVREHHGNAVAALRARCLRLLVPSRQGPAP